MTPNGYAAAVDKPAWFAEHFDALAKNIEIFIKGKHDTIRMVLVSMLAEGHVLIQDVPGTGKTSLAKAIAQSIKGTMRRIQFTPDLLPSDVCGVSVYDQNKREFAFHQGPVFANIVLADEINRASPKTQSALLEVMAERQVTVDSVPYLTYRPFVVLATQNPVEHGGTYDLPEAQLDRFMMRISIGYPDHAAESDVVRNITADMRTENLEPVMRTEDLANMIKVVRRVKLREEIISYIVTICAATRTMPDLRLGVSPRGSVLVAQAAQAVAATNQRGFVTPDDVHAVLKYVLPHRMILRPEAELQDKTAEGLLDQVLASVPVPTRRAGV
jgi:MoxR-like ATPase